MSAADNTPDRAPEKGDYRALTPSANGAEVPTDANGWPILKPGCRTCCCMGFIAIEPPPSASFAEGYCPECNGPDVQAARRANLVKLRALETERAP